MTTIAPYEVSLKDVGYRYFRHQAVRGVSATIERGKITGLLGRNGSGKTTLEMLIAGQMRATGEVTVAGEPVWENPRVMPNIAFVSESPAVLQDQRLTRTVDLWERVRPTFDREVVYSLLDAWEIPVRKGPGALSRGQKSAFFAALGIGSRAPLTIFDEIHLGMDAVLRRDFYDVLLKDFIDHPRTIIISNHNVTRSRTCWRTSSSWRRASWWRPEVPTTSARLTPPTASPRSPTCSRPSITDARARRLCGS
ncbi:ATP-binding cassette domain-containing protein [Trueperella sp.]|uniref:ATP-binding cassette domain-containing protein n=1 Tax=Trueperella sp. TaxID=2699835 RepID=UPI002629314E|nr:ATP-binding cassette domain-containing protein [Trueperella sp.]